MKQQIIYLDYAAATPLDERVLSAMQPYLSEKFYNPSAAYQPARDVRQDIEAARGSIARILGAKPTEIIFTAGATESINLAFSVGGHVVTTAIEHPAVLEAASELDHTNVGVNEGGRVDLDELKSAIRDDTRLISIGLINNEVGTVQALRPVARLIEEIRGNRLKNGNKTPLLLHTDASQSAGILDLSVARLGVDMLTLNGGKIYGLKQTGILYTSSSVVLQPIIRGGGQEMNLRSGTENVAGIIGLAKALEIADKKRKIETDRLANLRQQLFDTLQSAFKDILFIGDPKHHAPHILSVAWQGLDAERVLFSLESENILVATGSACGSNKDTRSHVLTALGLSSGVIDGSLRFSFGRQTTEKQIAQAGKIIVAVVKQELERGQKI